MKKRGKKAKKEKAENEAENGRKGKNVRYTPSGVLRRVILIFAALYLAGMGISTALVQQKFRQDHQRYLGDIADLVKLSMSEEIRDATAQGKEITSEWFANRLEFFLALCSSDPYVNWNAAVWDSEGDKIAERGAICFRTSGWRQHGPGDLASERLSYRRRTGSAGRVCRTGNSFREAPVDRI